MTISPLEKFIKLYGRLPTEFDPDYLEMLRMGLVRVLPVPDASPGKCSNCGASRPGRLYVDIGLHIEWYGAVFFCKLCLTEIAVKVGLFTQFNDTIARLNERIAELESTKDHASKLNETVTRTAEELKEFYVSIYPPRNEPSVDSTPSVESNSTESDSERAAATAKQPIKSNPSTKSSNVQSLADLLGNVD